MRFSFRLNFPDFINSTTLIISKNLQVLITSTIKSAIKDFNPNLYNQYWLNKKENKVKPFTFSYFAQNIKQERVENSNRITFDGNDIVVNISSFDQAFMFEFYNSLLQCKSTKYKNIELKISDFKVQQESFIDSSCCSFRVLSPIVVNKTDNKKNIDTLKHSDKEFNHSLYHNVKNLVGHHIHYQLDENDFSIDLSQCKSRKIHQYENQLNTTTGIIQIKAPLPVLDFIYKSGIGARRSQGFGMLEVL